MADCSYRPCLPVAASAYSSTGRCRMPAGFTSGLCISNAELQQKCYTANRKVSRQLTTDRISLWVRSLFQRLRRSPFPCLHSCIICLCRCIPGLRCRIPGLRHRIPCLRFCFERLFYLSACHKGGDGEAYRQYERCRFQDFHIAAD